MGKKDGDDDDDEDDEAAAPRDSHTPPEHAMMPHHLQHAQKQSQPIDVDTGQFVSFAIVTIVSVP